jgi:GTP-binding protein
METDTLQHQAAADGAPRRLPTVAIVGRPNVGKSTLFNRLVHGQRAIVDSQPGVTRDRNIAAVRWEGHQFILVDTGGFEDADQSTLATAVRAQSALAAAEADAVIAVFDGREGLNPIDRELVRRLRTLRKPILYAVNKLDTHKHDDEAAEFFALGLDEVFPISVAHGRGIGDLLERLVAQLPELPPTETPTEKVVTLALVGRPNVGKSSLLNRIVGAERAIVDATPGTTRDAVDTPFQHAGQAYVLVDTAGIRRRPHVHEQLERASAARSLRVLDRAEVALLVIDAVEGMADQDARIAGYAWERGRALLLVINKWDAVPRERRHRAEFRTRIQEHYATLADVPMVFVSALSGQGMQTVFPALERLVAAHRRHMRTTELNDLLGAATQAQAPASVHGKRPRFYYATQTGTAPPVITIFTSAPNCVQTAYERYLANEFRRAFELNGTPLRVRFRARPRGGNRDVKREA